MHIKTYKKWRIPLGWWIYLSHEEACYLTKSKVEAVGSALAKKIPWAGPLVAFSLVAQSKIARKKNENSGGKGIKLKFVWALGVITSIKSRGEGNSPC